MKVSIITWDASFRESYHTIDFFIKQDYPKDQFEFIWVDFYQNQNPSLLKKIEGLPNFSILNLRNRKDTPWHLGKCINAGIERSKGELLIIPDGDVVVPVNFLGTVEQVLSKTEEMAVYFRRWDEPKESHDDVLSYKFEYLSEVCKLFNPTNYAGAVAFRRNTIQRVGLYEANDIFSGPGANGLELYIRLRNAGVPIKWHPEKVFHPFHANTGVSDKYQDKLFYLSRFYKWLIPYSGIEQSWVIKCREANLDIQANSRTKEYLKSCPSIKDLEKALDKGLFRRAISYLKQ